MQLRHRNIDSPGCLEMLHIVELQLSDGLLHLIWFGKHPRCRSASHELVLNTHFFKLLSRLEKKNFVHWTWPLLHFSSYSTIAWAIPVDKGNRQAQDYHLHITSQNMSFTICPVWLQWKNRLKNNYSNKTTHKRRVLTLNSNCIWYNRVLVWLLLPSIDQCCMGR
jgi:hypothetical protein